MAGTGSFAKHFMNVMILVAKKLLWRRILVFSIRGIRQKKDKRRTTLNDQNIALNLKNLVTPPVAIPA
jgi:hypothetical protein